MDDIFEGSNNSCKSLSTSIIEVLGQLDSTTTVSEKNARYPAISAAMLQGKKYGSKFSFKGR